MIFNIIIILLVAVVAYFHYVEGFFSATVSAALAIIAAVLAFGYHETVVNSLLGGNMANNAHAMVIVALFALIYTVMRVIFDKFVPGNLRLPVLLDKLGGGVMGLIAGVFGVGVFAIAAQSMPFGITIGGYSRYEINEDRQVQIPTDRQQVDLYVFNELKDDQLNPTANPAGFNPQNASSLILPVDDLLVKLVSHLSDGGSLSGRPLKEVHPAFVDELYANRVGIEVGANTVMLNTAGRPTAALEKAYFFPTGVKQAEGEIPEIRPSRMKSDKRKEGLSPELKPQPNQTVLVLRVVMKVNSSDADKNFRVSTAAVRLVANRQNFRPIGTLESNGLLRANKLDDPIYVDVGTGDGAIDFVFLVPTKDVFSEGGDAKSRNGKFNSDVFFEVKRMTQFALGSEVAEAVTSGWRKESGVTRRAGLPGGSAPKAAPPADGGAGAAPAAAAAAAPFAFASATVADDLLNGLDIGEVPRGGDVSGEYGTATLKQGVASKVKTTAQPLRPKNVDYAVTKVVVPSGQRLVQVTGTPAGGAEQAWAWAERLSEFALVDAGGAKYKPSGAWVQLKQGTDDKFYGVYDSESTVPTIAPLEGRPTDVTLLFLIPAGTSVTALEFSGASVSPVTLPN